MNTAMFLLSLLIAFIGPLLAITYLKPILMKVLRTLCDAEGGAEFWVRSAYLLAICGTILLMLSFGDFNEHAYTIDALRRALWLVFTGIFLTVGFISSQVWGQVRTMLNAKTLSDQAAQRAAARAKQAIQVDHAAQAVGDIMAVDKGLPG